MKRRIPFAVRAALLVLMLIVFALGASVVLTDPDPASLFTRRRLGLLVGPGGRPPQGESTSAPRHPAPTLLFSEEWFDDSGFSFIRHFTGPSGDPTSLDQLRASLEGRGRRGIAVLSERLEALDPADPGRLATASRLHWLIGALCMFEGEFARAARHFESARDLDPSAPPDHLANLEALIGVAHLRRGEADNCVACCNEASCIYPLAPSAIHQQPDGSRAAIRHFLAYLEKRPEDRGVQWLLNVAAMTVGEYPGAVPPRFRLPVPTPPSVPGLPRMTNVASRVGLADRGENMAGGSVLDDFDNDHLPDIFLSTSDPARGAALFRNRGDGTFEDRSAPAGLEPQVGALNVTHADFDNDGALDVLLLRGGWEAPRRMSLLRNRGNATFDDVTVDAGLAAPIASQAAAWADYDGDGNLDLYVAGEYDPDRPDPRNAGRLYHNRGDGSFEEVAAIAGVANLAYGKGVAWGDYDADGDPDLYIANLGQPNRLYRNDGSRFADVASDLGVTAPTYAFACWFWDYDNDGRLDLYVNPYGATLNDVVRSQFGPPGGAGERPRLYRNLGGTFRDVTAEVGLDRVVMPMGSSFGDIDNDGFLDIYLGTGKPSFAFLTPNVMLRNVGGRRFDDVTGPTATGHLQKGHGVAFEDWDRDGDLDLLVEAGGAAPGDRAHNLLFQNPGSGRHWLRVRLVGTRSNRSAFGATIRATLRMPDGTTQLRHRVVGTNSSFGGNALAQTIGLGDARTVESLEITWPAGGGRQVFRNLARDTALVITEGSNRPVPLDWKPIPLPPG